MNLRKIASTILVAAALGTSAHASSSCLPVLLTIDISDPSAVKITSTGLNAGANDRCTSENDGIDLESFFSSPVSIETDPPACGNLTPSGCGTIPYDTWDSDNASGCNVDLNLYSTACDADDILQKFSKCDIAFDGTLTLDLSDYICELPGVGDCGVIIAGYSDNEGNVIGLWKVICTPVPEPSQYGLGIALALIALAVSRRTSLCFSREA